MQTVDSLEGTRKGAPCGERLSEREEAMKVIDCYESIMADPIRMEAISEPKVSMALFRIRCRALQKQWGIRKQSK